jgi:hypothetical protein
VKVVQQLLGHKSATMTLGLYGHLFPDQLDQVADRLDAAARAVVYPGRHHHDIGGLRKRENPLLSRRFVVVAPTGFEPALTP